MKHNIARTRGGVNQAKDFFWYICNDRLIIQKISSDRIDDRLYIGANWTNQGRHFFTQNDITSALFWLFNTFQNEQFRFPLANNVKGLGNGTEIDGFGVALYTLRPETYYAQGSSYLGVVLEDLGILTFEQANVITWKFAEGYHTFESIEARVNQCFELANI